MVILILVCVLIYLYLFGHALNYKISGNWFILAFFTFYLIAIIPVLLIHFKILNFSQFTYVIGSEIILSTIYSLFVLTKNKFRFKKLELHVIIASCIWILIYLLNTHFSVLSGNGFDDYYYIAFQNHLIQNITHQITPTFHPHATIDGWIYVSSAICKLFNVDVSLFNKFVMSAINIIFTVYVFDNTLKIFNKNKYCWWYPYISLILIIFPIISFEYWFGSISRLIYRPFYGSSLSALALPLLMVYLFEQIKNNKKQIVNLFLFIIWAIIMIHAINIVIFIFLLSCYLFLLISNKYLRFTLPVIILFFIWTILKLFFPSTLIVHNNNSTFEYWNIMYDFTRWTFVMIYLFSLLIFIINQNKTKLDLILVVFVPTFTLILFFTSLKNLVFNIIFGFGIQRFLSQILALICISFFVKLFSTQNKYLVKFYIWSCAALATIFIQQTSIYSGIHQQISAYKNHNVDLKMTNLTRQSNFTNQVASLVKPKSIILTQHWINIDYNNQIPKDSYYNYVASSTCSLNLYSNLSTSHKTGLVYESTNIQNFNNVWKEVQSYKANYILVSEKYYKPNGFICNENLNYLYNKFAQKYILAQSPDINQKQIIQKNQLVKTLITKHFPYQEVKLLNYKSKFGKIYLFEIK